MILPMTQEDYEKASSKFALPGMHLSEIIEVPVWDTPNVSIKFEFKIIESGEDFGKTGKISAPVSAKGAFKMKECLEATGIKPKMVKTKDGTVHPKVDFLEALGKQVYTEWTEEVDKRTAAEGGTGRKYSKPQRFHSIAAGRKILGLSGAVDDIEGNLDVVETE
jgi:hypothetical protein